MFSGAEEPFTGGYLVPLLDSSPLLFEGKQPTSDLAAASSPVPTSTHSTTKMLPLWSKQAPCGQMNWPGMNLSRGSRLSGLFQFGSFESPELRDEGVALVHQRHAPVQIGDHDQALTLVEVAGQPEAGDEVDVLPVHA